MIRLGLRLAVAGGREAVLRLALIATAVAIGGCLLLATLAGIAAVHTQNDRYAWLETGYPGSDAPALTSAPSSGGALWWQLRGDVVHGRQIGRVDVAAAGPDAPLPPGIPALPQPGEYDASPALAELLATLPADELADRYPGHMVGEIRSDALPSPDTLVIIIGRSAAELSTTADARLVDRISTTSPGDCTGDCGPFGFDSSSMTLILSVVVAALLFPVLIFIGSATRLAAARREQRFAAMRLVGATPRQVAIISTVESTLATVVGVLGAFVGFAALRPLLARIPFTGEPFFDGDFVLSARAAAVVAVAIPVLGAVAAWVALRRVSISPLGVSRRVTPGPPRAWRLLPLVAGLAELAYFAYVRDIGVASGTAPTSEALAFLVGVLATIIGLVVAGPWLTMVGARFAAWRATGAPTLIAARRLGDDPKAAFRAVSGVVVAVFVASCATGVITTIVATSGQPSGATAADRGTVVALVPFEDAASTDVAVRQRLVDAIGAVPGVTGVAAIHFVEQSAQAFSPVDQYVACRELAAVPAFGTCPGAAAVVRVEPTYGGSVVGRPPMAANVWPAAAFSPGELEQLPIGPIAIATDGSAAAIERVRTVLASGPVTPFAAETLAEQQQDSTRTLDRYQRLATVVILTSLPIAGCSLAVSLAGGLAERRRPFSLLRLAGTPLTVLRRVIAYETAIPLVTAAVISAVAGLLSAHFFLRAQLYETLVRPTATYYWSIAAGLVLSLAVVASTFPLIRRITGPDGARTD